MCFYVAAAAETTVRQPSLHTQAFLSYIFIYGYVDHVVPVFDKSNLNRCSAVDAPARDGVHHAVWCLLEMPDLARFSPTLPEPASAVLASTPRDRCCFVFLVIITVPIPHMEYIFVHIYAYQSVQTGS